MKNKLLVLLAALFSLNNVSSQKILTGLDANKEIQGAKLIRYVERSIYPNHIIFANQNSQMRDLSSWMGSVLKFPKDYSLQMVNVEYDQIGFTHQEYKQLYKGIPVEFGEYKTHFRNGKLESMNGDIFKVDNINAVPNISSGEAILIAKQYTHAEKYKWEEGKTNSLNYYPTTELVVLVHEKRSYLAFKVDVYSIQPLSRKYIYVDAATGNIITEMERLHDVDTPGTANTAYSGSRPITIDYNGVDYTLTETGRNLETINSATMLTYSNPTNTWTLAGLDQYALDAHWGTEMTYDYYLNTFGRDGLDGAHYFLTSYVNEGPGFGNAYWDGSTVHYGDGDGSFFLTPLTTVGIVGHEATHGVTQFTAGLIYAGESGAMNESFSDIFGLCIDKYARNVNLSLPATWLVGAECTGGVGFRDMSNPNFFSMADTYGGNFWNAGDIVHYDSGVQNFWFYLLTMGGSGTNDNADAYNVTGIGIADAQSIAYRNLAFYLSPGSTFADSRYYSLIAAQDLFGPCSPQVESTANAWYAVGVGAPYQNVTVASFTSGNPVSCEEPINVSFTNLSFNAASYLWDFGDGDTSTLENPTHSFLTSGTYTIQLISTGCGLNVADTFQISITISTGSSILDMNPLQSQDISCCSGSLFDSGGLFGDYTDGEFCSASITVPVGDVVNVDFVSFDTEDTYDFVYLYDGPNASYPLIGSYTGNTLPNAGNPIVSTSNQVYIEFTSDGSVIAPGFELNWYCTPPGPPTSLFTSSLNTVCIGSVIEYYNNSTFGDSISWDFQGGSPGSSNADTVLVTYNTLGNYTTTLTALNILGSNSSSSTINVVPLPTPSITLIGNVVSVTTTFSTYQWYLNGGLIAGATNQNYTVTQGGSYYCEVTDVNGCIGTSNTVISTLSVHNENDGAIIIYPNPASTTLFISSAALVNGQYRISITNVLGELVYTAQENNSSVIIDLSSIKPGSYFVNISGDNWEMTKKVIVIR